MRESADPDRVSRAAVRVAVGREVECETVPKLSALSGPGLWVQDPRAEKRGSRRTLFEHAGTRSAMRARCDLLAPQWHAAQPAQLLVGWRGGSGQDRLLDLTLAPVMRLFR